MEKQIIERLIEEHKQLKERRERLDDALREDELIDKVGISQYKLMCKQSSAMLLYEIMLTRRLTNLGINYKTYQPLQWGDNITLDTFND